MEDLTNIQRWWHLIKSTFLKCNETPLRRFLLLSGILMSLSACIFYSYWNTFNKFITYESSNQVKNATRELEYNYLIGILNVCTDDSLQAKEREFACTLVDKNYFDGTYATPKIKELVKNKLYKVLSVETKHHFEGVKLAEQMNQELAQNPFIKYKKYRAILDQFPFILMSLLLVITISFYTFMHHLNREKELANKT